MKNLTNSVIDRKNILNNRLAVEAIQKQFQFPGAFFEGEYRYTKKMVAEFYAVDISTIDRYLTEYSEELSGNGYILLTGKALKNFKSQFGHLMDKATKTTKMGVFSFRSFLDIGMLLVESEKARWLRSVILDIVIAVIHNCSSSGTKYINRRDARFMQASFSEANYRKAFASAVEQFVQGHDTSECATDFIYQAIFKENASQYRELLKLDPEDSLKQTLYTEVLLLIAAFENACATEIRMRVDAAEGGLVSLDTVKEIINEQAALPVMEPLLNDARSKMASRDLSFRDVFHSNLAGYIRALSTQEYERFLGNDSVDFDSILSSNEDILKRLK